MVRIRDSYRDQIRETGHHARLADLDAIAPLGVRTLRYPVLWETVSPDNPEQADWSWHDERLGRLRELEIAPIAGLVHHGSGPSYTNLLDPGFADGLARHALRVATRYPWIEMFTPVNEPLTTARFSCLYGHWYPHVADEPSFLKALIVQCRAIVLSMRAIRTVTPHARLVQTEDLGRIFSTSPLRHQARYENTRRWLSLDLLCGRVGASHPWYEAFLTSGSTREELEFFLGADGTPNIVGVNHYLTSDRYLDHRSANYSEALRGGNGRDTYADVEAVRMPLPAKDVGPAARLREAWRRYRLPIAVTEAHHGCTREEQLRWLVEVWKAAEQVKAEGADVRAVTIWALFGAVDWNSLLTRRAGFYEPGAFDVRSDPPRPTALAGAIASLTRSGKWDRAIADEPGWWRRDDRFYRPGCRVAAKRAGVPILITGAHGALGRMLQQVCRARGLEALALGRKELDVSDRFAVDATLQQIKPWAVLNASGLPPAKSGVSKWLYWRENVSTAEALAWACRRSEIPLATFSADAVFDGTAERPYLESDPVLPAGAFGCSKAEAERRVVRHHNGALIIRTGPFLSTCERSFLLGTLRDLAAGRPAVASDRELVSPVYLPDLAHATLDLLIDGEIGVWHASSRGALTLFELVERAAHAVGLGTSSLSKRYNARMGALSTARGFVMPPLAGVVERWALDSERLWRESAAETRSLSRHKGAASAA